jgi:uncharacterized protein involved in cysteine biosynthesis
VALDIAGIWTVLHFTGGSGDEEWWGRIGLLLLRIAGIGIVLLAAPVLAMFVSNTLFPVLAERVFLAGMRAVDPARADELAALPGLPLRIAIGQNLIRMLMFIGLSVGAFALSFVPVVGSIGGPVLQVYFTARALGWELLDPYFEKLEYRFDAQHRFVREHRAPLVGFALPYSLVMAIPILGPFAFGIAQAAAGVFTREILETPLNPQA